MEKIEISGLCLYALFDLPDIRQRKRKEKAAPKIDAIHLLTVIHHNKEVAAVSTLDDDATTSTEPGLNDSNNRPHRTRTFS